MVRATGVLAFLTSATLLAMLYSGLLRADLQGTVDKRGQPRSLTVRFSREPDMWAFCRFASPLEMTCADTANPPRSYFVDAPRVILASAQAGDELSVNLLGIRFPGRGWPVRAARFELRRGSELIVAKGMSPVLMIGLVALAAAAPLWVWAILAGSTDLLLKGLPRLN